MATVSFAAPKAETVRIEVLDAARGIPHSSRVVHLIQESCPSCKIQLHSIYNQAGELDLKLMLSQLKLVRKPTRILNLSWNLEYEPKFEPIVAELNRIIDDGIFVVGASGQPEAPDLANNPLVEQTVLGKVRNIILVAELNSKNRIPLGSYTGDKIIFAFRNAKGDQGSSFTAAKVSGVIGKLLAHGLGPRLNQTDVAKVLETVRDKKKNALESWPKVEQIF